MLLYLLSFISGFLVKAVDWVEDDLKKPLGIRWALAIGAGTIIGYLISVASFSNIFLAALFAQVFAKKVDKASHAATALTAALVFMFMGVNSFEIGYFLILLIPAFIDELEFPKKFAFLTDYRVFLNLAAIGFGVFVGRWDYFFGIFTFDLGYLAFKYIPVCLDYCGGKTKKVKKTRKK